MLLTIQYLEDSPALSNLSVRETANKLRCAGQMLPITHILLGWHVPAKLEEACRKESERISAKLLRWHPLLTGDGEFKPNPRWQVVGLSGARVRGYHNMPEFTFVCPNNLEAKEESIQHIQNLIKTGLYDGFFLDRVRFPSPAHNPHHTMGCFCTHCKRTAQEKGINLAETQLILEKMVVNKKYAADLVRAMFGKYEKLHHDFTEALIRFFLFRYESITHFVSEVCKPLREKRLEIGLDGFAPSLTYMVGQNLKQLGEYVDWIKIMTYAHTLGPAGMPFEALGVLDYLISMMGFEEKEAISLLSEVMEIDLPLTYKALQKEGFSSKALGKEVERGVQSTTTPILAGLEMVDIKGVTHFQKTRMETDLHAVKNANPAGVSISWDLAHIPLERLELFRHVWWKGPVRD